MNATTTRKIDASAVYMRHEPNPYRGDRYAIYERCEGRSDRLIFWSHSREAALLHLRRLTTPPEGDSNDTYPI